MNNNSAEKEFIFFKDIRLQIVTSSPNGKTFLPGYFSFIRNISSNQIKSCQKLLTRKSQTLEMISRSVTSKKLLKVLSHSRTDFVTFTQRNSWCFFKLLDVFHVLEVINENRRFFIWCDWTSELDKFSITTSSWFYQCYCLQNTDIHGCIFGDSWMKQFFSII